MPNTKHLRYAGSARPSEVLRESALIRRQDSVETGLISRDTRQLFEDACDAHLTPESYSMLLRIHLSRGDE